jgi:hypothetical protein
VWIHHICSAGRKNSPLKPRKLIPQAWYDRPPVSTFLVPRWFIVRFPIGWSRKWCPLPLTMKTQVTTRRKKRAHPLHSSQHSLSNDHQNNVCLHYFLRIWPNLWKSLKGIDMLNTIVFLLRLSRKGRRRNRWRGQCRAARS